MSLHCSNENQHSRGLTANQKTRHEQESQIDHQMKLTPMNFRMTAHRVNLHGTEYHHSSEEDVSELLLVTNLKGMLEYIDVHIYRFVEVPDKYMLISGMCGCY